VLKTRRSGNGFALLALGRIVGLMKDSEEYHNHFEYLYSWQRLSLAVRTQQYFITKCIEDCLMCLVLMGMGLLAYIQFLYHCFCHRKIMTDLILN